MKKIFLFFLFFLLKEETVLANPYGDEGDVTIIVGNTRKMGSVNPSLIEIVGQREADFTHKHSFKGSVVSFDITNTPVKDLPHIVGDATSLSAKELSALLNQARRTLSSPPTRLLFEWFPSSIMNADRNNLRPCLLQALQNLSSLLVPGGEVLIDLMPYTCSLPSNRDQALQALRQSPVDQKHIRKSVFDALPQHTGQTAPGIVSQYLQKADPFTLHWSQLEVADIRGHFLARLQDKMTAKRDIQTNFEAATRASEEVSAIFGLNKQDTMKHLMEKLADSPFDPIVCMFEWVYHMRSRGSLMLGALRQIGLEVKDTAITYYRENPFNKRKHAWIIRATKPSANTASTSSQDA